ncbi:hypothetical protein MK489_14445 [Myxococcota bacterium]|nr:hypothetical protein [Myxococcota bacterium]
MRGYGKSGVVDQIRRDGGEIYAITSEPQSLATEAEEAWGHGFSCIGDPHHEIIDTCRERGWLSLFVSRSQGLLKFRSWASHPKGYLQPAVLALTPEGRVLYRWRCRPTRQNVGGAISRPTPGHVWRNIQARLERDCEEPELDDAPELDQQAPPWSLFVLMLMAHGWFLRPRPFPLGRANEKPPAHPARMIPRILAFAGIWIGAFALLPKGWVALALTAWAVLLWRGVTKIHREFQNIPRGEPEPI